VQIEGGCGRGYEPRNSRAAVADRQVLEPPVDDEIDERRRGKDAVGDEILYRTSRRSR